MLPVFFNNQSINNSISNAIYRYFALENKYKEEALYNSKGAMAIINQACFNEELKFEAFTNVFHPEFTDMWEKHRSAFTGIYSFAVHEVFVNSIDFLQRLTANITATLTDDASIHITARFADFKVFVEVFFEKNNLNPIEVILNVFQDKECVLAHSGSLQSVFEKIKKYIYQRYYQDSTNYWSNGLSEQIAAESAFQNYSVA
ncbi:MAG: hypothetical protein ACLQQ4_07570 [Bacteroidia bacterium]